MAFFGRFLGFLRGNFFAGLLILAPLMVVGWILMSVLSFLWNFKTLVPIPQLLVEDAHPFILFSWNALTLLVIWASLLGIVSFIGFISKLYLGRTLLGWIGSLIEKIPVVRSIYSSLNQLLKTMASGEKNQFSRVVYFEFPRAGSYSLGFVTGNIRLPGDSHTDYLNIFIPTTPNPTSGFYLIVKATEVKDAHLTVEEAFKQLISFGIAQSEAKIHG